MFRSCLFNNYRPNILNTKFVDFRTLATPYVSNFQIQRQYSNFLLTKYKKNNNLILTLIESIYKNQELRKYMRDIYVKVGFGFSTTLIVSTTIGTILRFIKFNPTIFWSCWISSFGFTIYSGFKINNLSTQIIQKENQYYEIKNKSKEFWYKAFSIFYGIFITPLVCKTLITSPTIMPIAFVSTLGIFSAATWIALKQPTINLIHYYVPLTRVLYCLLFVLLVNRGAQKLSYELFNSQLDLITTLGLIAVAFGFININTQQAIKDYYVHTHNSDQVTIELLSIVINLFVNIIVLTLK